MSTFLATHPQSTIISFTHGNGIAASTHSDAYGDDDGDIVDDSLVGSFDDLRIDGDDVYRIDMDWFISVGD
jgi:hypothetical protein